MDFIKKIFTFLANLPAFTRLFQKASQTGRIEPVEALGALASISPSTKQIADMGVKTAQNGGAVQDVARQVANMGEVEIMGQKINTRTMTTQLKQAGGICAILGNMLEKMQAQSPQEIVEFGEAASRIDNWKNLFNQGGVSS